MSKDLVHIWNMNVHEFLVAWDERFLHMHKVTALVVDLRASHVNYLLPPAYCHPTASEMLSYWCFATEGVERIILFIRRKQLF